MPSAASTGKRKKGGGAAAAASSASPPAYEHEVVEPGGGKAGGVVPVVEPGGKEGGEPVGDKAPALESLQNQLCPNCSVGVLYVTRYDVDALHEAGQDVGQGTTPAPLPAGFESGGAYDVKCFHCEWSQSYPFNPGKHYGKGR